MFERIRVNVENSVLLPVERTAFTQCAVYQRVVSKALAFLVSACNLLMNM